VIFMFNAIPKMARDCPYDNTITEDAVYSINYYDL